MPRYNANTTGYGEPYNPDTVHKAHRLFEKQLEKYRQQQREKLQQVQEYKNRQRIKLLEKGTPYENIDQEGEPVDEQPIRITIQPIEPRRRDPPKTHEEKIQDELQDDWVTSDALRKQRQTNPLFDYRTDDDKRYKTPQPKHSRNPQATEYVDTFFALPEIDPVRQPHLWKLALEKLRPHNCHPDYVLCRRIYNTGEANYFAIYAKRPKIDERTEEYWNWFDAPEGHYNREEEREQRKEKKYRSTHGPRYRHANYPSYVLDRPDIPVQYTTGFYDENGNQVPPPWH